MDKKVYVTPEMEMEEVEMVTFMQTYSGDDPIIYDEPGGGVND